MVPVYINELCLLYHRNLLTNTQQQLFNGRLSGQPVPGDQDNPARELEPQLAVTLTSCSTFTVLKFPTSLTVYHAQPSLPGLTVYHAQPSLPGLTVYL